MWFPVHIRIHQPKWIAIDIQPRQLLVFMILQNDHCLRRPPIGCLYSHDMLRMTRVRRRPFRERIALAPREHFARRRTTSAQRALGVRRRAKCETRHISSSEVKIDAKINTLAGAEQSSTPNKRARPSAPQLPPLEPPEHSIPTPDPVLVTT